MRRLLQPIGLIITFFVLNAGSLPLGVLGMPQALALSETPNESTSARATLEDPNCVDSRAGFQSSPWIVEVCQIVNRERAKVGIRPLTLDTRLSEVGQSHAQDMSQRSYFSHDTPEGRSPFDRIRAARISYQSAAENIAHGQRSPKEVMNSWMKSPGHRTNLMNPRFAKIGIGFSDNYWVQVFTN